MPKARTVWKVIVLNGMGLMGLGLAAFSIDYAAVGQFDFIERHYDAFGLAILIGSVCLLVGLIGWAKLLGKAGRARVATLALVLPVIIMVTANLSMGGNVHGVFPLFVLSLAPVMAIGLLVAIMASKSRG